MTEESREQRVRIFLLEDNPADAGLIRLALRSANLDCELTVVEDGAEGLALVRQEGKYSGLPVPDLAVLDLNLPKNDGLEVLEAMRKSPVFRPVTVAVLSSSASPRDRARTRDLGVALYIIKPLELGEFMQIGSQLKGLLEESGSPRQQ